MLTVLMGRGCSWKCGGQDGRDLSASLSHLHPEFRGLCPELGVAWGWGQGFTAAPKHTWSISRSPSGAEPGVLV